MYPNLSALIENKDLTQKQILDLLNKNFIKQLENSEIQSETAEKQFKNNRYLTLLALIFAFISIVPILREYIPIFAPKNPDRDKYELQNKVLLQSNTILENQIEVLKKQNEILLRKKS